MRKETVAADRNKSDDPIGPIPRSSLGKNFWGNSAERPQSTETWRGNPWRCLEMNTTLWTTRNRSRTFRGKLRSRKCCGSTGGSPRKPQCGTREFYRIIVRFLMGSPVFTMFKIMSWHLDGAAPWIWMPTVANVKLENARLLRTETETKTTAGSKLNLPVRTFWC